MPQKCLCFTLKTGVFFMVFAITILGVVCLWAGSEQNNFLNKGVRMKTVCYPLLGFTLMISAFVLLFGALEARSDWIFTYLVMSSTCLFFLTVIVIILAPFLLWVFAALWYGQICVNSFYALVVDGKLFTQEVIATFNEDVTIVRIV